MRDRNGNVIYREVILGGGNRKTFVLHYNNISSLRGTEMNTICWIFMLMTFCYRGHTVSPSEASIPKFRQGTGRQRGRGRPGGNCPLGHRRSKCSCSWRLSWWWEIGRWCLPSQGCELVLELCPALDTPAVHHILRLPGLRLVVREERSEDKRLRWHLSALTKGNF